MPRPNKAMRDEARRGLDWRAEYKRGGTYLFAIYTGLITW